MGKVFRQPFADCFYAGHDGAGEIAFVESVRQKSGNAIPKVLADFLVNAGVS